jgi:hypothetical protein
MPFIFSKILDHGTSHPVVARLQLQVGELLKSTTLDEATREAVFAASFQASMRLIRCFDIRATLAAEYERLEAERKPRERNMPVTIPHVVGLQHEAESFLYEFKNFLRDFAAVVNAAYGTKFEEAARFCDFRGVAGSDIRQWAARLFGEDDALPRFLSLNEAWIVELIQMRNAVEHPGGRAGNLRVINYEVTAVAGLERPRWVRNENPATPILDDMTLVCEQALSFADELTAMIISKHLPEGFCQIYAIPEGERNPACPRSYVVGLTESMANRFLGNQ